MPSDVRAAGHRLQVVFLQGQLGADEPVESVGVVLVEDRDAADAQVLHHVAHCGLGLLIVGGADVDHVGVEGLAQRVGPGEHAHQGDARLLHQGQHLDRGRRAHVAEQGEHVARDDELLGVGEAAGRVVGVVVGDDAYLSAVHPAAVVDEAYVRLGTAQGLGAQIARVAGEGQRRAQPYLVCGHAGRRAAHGIRLVRGAAPHYPQ
jgi:hypothetical protein